MFEHFLKKGRASFVLDGQWGSGGKGAAVASLMHQLDAAGRAPPDVVTTNNGAQSGHTSVYQGITKVAFHIPTAALWAKEMGYKQPVVYLNGGAIIDPDVLKAELEEFGINDRFAIHPHAAVITPECKEAEGRNDSAQTKIASTRKGVGEALSRKVLRSGMVAKNHQYLSQFVHRIDLNEYLRRDHSVLVEIPQGIGLSLDGPFYPHTTSRNCTVMQAMADAGIHPRYYGQSMLVLRTYPIRVGNIIEDLHSDGQWGPSVSKVELGNSGGCYPDQREVSWEELGQKAEITTVTKRVRRVFTFSYQQAFEAMVLTRPDIVYVTFCDYLRTRESLEFITQCVHEAAYKIGMERVPQVYYQYGPSTSDLKSQISAP